VIENQGGNEMNLYTFRFKPQVWESEAQVVGTKESIFHLANEFENSKKKFTVSDFCGILAQEDFGYGGFKYWVMKLND
jgi:hypothetical protein